MLDRARRYITLHSVAYAIYISAVRPILEYCAEGWAYSRESSAALKLCQLCRSE